jgi:hypothetical protein
MRFDPEQAETLLPRVDPGRMRSGRAVGLRDGAVLALIAAGFTATEIAALRASAVRREGRSAVIDVERNGIIWLASLSPGLGARLLAWLTEAQIWGLPEPLFKGCRGPLTPMGVFKVFERYRTLSRSRSPRGAL